MVYKMNRLLKISNLLKEAEVHGKLATVYHGSRTPPEEFEKFWKSGDYRSGEGSGNMYGPGIYSIYQKTGETRTERGEYGKYVYKFIVNISDYLILDENVFDTVHPEKATLSYKEKLKFQFKNYVINWNKKIPEVQPEFTSDIADKIKMGGLHQGIIFTGRQDGKVCVIFTPYSARMIGYSEGKKINKFDSKKIREANPVKEPLKRQGYTEKEKIEISLKFNFFGTLFHYTRKNISKILGEERLKEILTEYAEKNIDNDSIEPTNYVHTYPELVMPIVRKIAENDGKKFFEKNLQIYYPEFAHTAAEKLKNDDIDSFFEHLDQIGSTIGEHNKNIIEMASEKLADNNPRSFFYYIDKISKILNGDIKKLVRLASRQLAQYHSKKFFNYFEKIKKVLGDESVEFAQIATKRLSKIGPDVFFDSLDDIKKELGDEAIKITKIMAKRLSENFSSEFFNYYDEINQTIGSDSKELALVAVKKLVKDEQTVFFDNFRLIKFIFENDVIEFAQVAAENLANNDPLVLFRYFKKIKQVMGERGAKDIFERLTETAPQLFFNYFEEIGEGLGWSEADRLRQLAESKTASTKITRFNKIARCLRLSKLG